MRVNQVLMLLVAAGVFAVAFAFTRALWSIVRSDAHLVTRVLAGAVMLLTGFFTLFSGLCGAAGFLTVVTGR